VTRGITRQQRLLCGIKCGRDGGPACLVQGDRSRVQRVHELACHGAIRGLRTGGVSVVVTIVRGRTEGRGSTASSISSSTCSIFVKCSPRVLLIHCSSSLRPLKFALVMFARLS